MKLHDASRNLFVLLKATIFLRIHVLDISGQHSSNLKFVRCKIFAKFKIKGLSPTKHTKNIYDIVIMKFAITIT